MADDENLLLQETANSQDIQKECCDQDARNVSKRNKEMIEIEVVQDSKEHLLDNLDSHKDEKYRSMKTNAVVKLKEDSMLEAEYDAYEDNKQVYRKYRLRETRRVAEKYPPMQIFGSKKIKTPEKEPAYYIPCSLCSKTFTSKTGLLNHMRMHQTEKKFTCALCFVSFPTNALLVAHKDVHDTEKRSYICAQCRFAFTDHLDFLLHIVSHTNRATYRCVECGLSYKKESYKAHILMHYKAKKVQCKICFHYYTEKYIATHVKTHSGMYICEECGKDCKDKKQYDYHNSTHTGVKKYQCLYCGKGFYNNGQRIVHTRIHTDEKPFECDQCPFKFRQKTDLVRHRARHFAEKKFQCDVCKKKYLHKIDLRNHIRSHTKDNLYECVECDHKCASMTGMKAHMLHKHLKEKLHKCQICDLSFATSSGLSKHGHTKVHKRNEFSYNKKNL